MLETEQKEINRETPTPAVDGETVKINGVNGSNHTTDTSYTGNDLVDFFDKIFQPYYTNQPDSANGGTSNGLSLSSDIQKSIESLSAQSKNLDKISSGISPL